MFDGAVPVRNRREEQIVQLSSSADAALARGDRESCQQAIQSLYELFDGVEKMDLVH